ncbi:MAG: hypothetical protein EOO00_00180 [Chitinophagaceae bacterium]|nr:MAG: hypothetical protein EOO00_00180 [Chitinophagaceae bacterium]
MNNQPRRIDSIILENEMLLMKLNAEFGAKVFLGEGKIEPHIQNHFLKSVYAFEQQAAQMHDREIIYNRIGAPVFKDPDQMNDAEITRELESIRQCLFEHRIVLDTLTSYPDRLIYRFITDEFMHMEIDTWDNDPSVMHFCYEDFYPNHELDLRQTTKFFVKYLMDLEPLLPALGLYKRCRTSDGVLLSRDRVTDKINGCCNEFEDRKLLTLEFKDISILDEVAFVEFEICYSVVLRGGENMEIKGTAALEFVNNDDIWQISFIDIPGIVI